MGGGAGADRFFNEFMFAFDEELVVCENHKSSNEYLPADVDFLAV